MENNIRFITRRYNWGWSIWLEVGGKKTLLVDKLRDKDAVNTFIKTLPMQPIVVELTEKQKGRLNAGCI